MRTALETVFLVGILGTIGCGGGSGASPPSGSGGQGGTTNPIGTGGSGAGGGASGFGGMPSGGGGAAATFRLSGTVAPQTAALLSADYLALAPTPRTVTHVMAVNPSSQDPRRMLAPVATDGTFSLDLEPGLPWVLVFLDSSRIGSDMIAGVFRASELDTLAPAMPGAADLGTVTMTGDTATAGIAYADLLAALHLSSSAADLLGATDDVCLRYVNPDIDGDGLIDCNETDHNFQLDFHVQFAMRSSDPASSVGATIADIAEDFLATDTAIAYGGVGIYATFADAFSTVDPTTAWAAFDMPAYYFPGGRSPGAMADAGAHITGADLLVMGDAGSPAHSLGIYAAAGHDLPQGQYQFYTGSHTMTFTDIRTHTDAELSAAADFIMPFVHLVKMDGCTGDCPISSVDFKWMKRTTAGWVPATVEELTLIVNAQGGYISVVKTYDNGDQHIGMVIPSNVQSGSLPWASASLNGLSLDELTATKVSEICHFGLSYDDKLGMRMFSGIGNTPGTCPIR